MKFTTSLVVIAASALATQSSAANLRANNIEARANTEERRLFLDSLGGLLGGASPSVTLPDILQQFQPSLSDAIQPALNSNLENLDLGINFQQELANIEVSPGCTADAAIQYQLGKITGLGSFQVESIQAVPGTGDLDFSLANGATWSGQFQVIGNFVNDLAAEAQAFLTSDACGKPLEETSTGAINAANAGMELLLTITGSSPTSLADLGDSVANSITVDDAKFIFDSITTNIDGDFGNNLELDLGTILEGLLTDALLNQLLPMILQLLTDLLSGGLPF